MHAIEVSFITTSHEYSYYNEQYAADWKLMFGHRPIEVSFITHQH